MRDLLIATGSKGKFPEIVKKLEGVPFIFRNLSDEGFPPDYQIDEPFETFEENALHKARTIAKKTGKLTLAEDSGLEVDALGGRPGALSARYAEGSDKDRYEKLLGEMNNVPDGKRGAHFKAVVAIVDPESGKERTCEGAFRGEIVREPQGENGFGYDPIFFSTELQKTSAQASLEEKNSVSHRGRALEKAKGLLLAEFI